jgi:hypothetical protein
LKVTFDAGTVMVRVRAVIGAVELNVTSSSSNQALLEPTLPAKVAEPPPAVGGGLLGGGLLGGGLAGALTVTGMVAVWLSEPLVPVTVTVAEPAAAELAAVKVKVLVDAVEAGLNDAVTPLGRPLAARLTALVKPPEGETVTVDVALPPGVRDRLLPAESPKFGVAAALTVSATVV